MHCLNRRGGFILVKQVYTTLKNKHKYVRNLANEQGFLFSVGNLKVSFWVSFS